MDVIITATSASEPVVRRGDFSTTGCYFSAIGSEYEVDPHVLLDASKIIIETPECKIVPYGSAVSLALEAGIINDAGVYAEFSDILNGKFEPRKSTEEFIYFETAGVAFEDAIPAKIAFSNAEKMGLGTQIDMYAGQKVW